MASDKVVLLCVLIMASCTSENKGSKSQTFGKTRVGEPVELFTLTNSKGMQADMEQEALAHAVHGAADELREQVVANAP